MVTENEIRNAIQLAKKAKEKNELWDGEPELDICYGYIQALQWVLGEVRHRRYRP